MKKQFQEPELGFDCLDDRIDCLTISDGDHDQQGPASEKAPDA